MTERSQRVQRTTRASVSRVWGLLHHHPDTAMTAVLALAYPTMYAGDATWKCREIRRAQDARGDFVYVDLEWDVRLDAEHRSNFSGVLTVSPHSEGAHLELCGVIDEHTSDVAALERVLEWLTFAAESATTSEDR